MAFQKKIPSDLALDEESCQDGKFGEAGRNAFAGSFVHGYISAFREKQNSTTRSYNLQLRKLWERGTKRRSTARPSGRQFGSEHRPWPRGMRPQPRSRLPLWYLWEAVLTVQYFVVLVHVWYGLYHSPAHYVSALLCGTPVVQLVGVFL